MSAGHPHKAPNLLAHGGALHRLLTTGHAPELMRRWQHFDLDHDIVYLAGYNVAGTTRYADRDFVRALYDEAYAKQILGEAIDTGLSPDDTLECILRHEAIEKVIDDDPSNPIDFYDHHDEPGGFGAHEFATIGEHELVVAKGGTPRRYEQGLKKIIAFCQAKPLLVVPKDYACAPLLDDPGPRADAVLRHLRKLGVTDAFKLSKEKVDYSPSTMAGHNCGRCSHWQNADRKALLSTCEIVDGLVGNPRWCKRFVA